MNLLRRLVCRLRGHVMRFNGGDAYCSRCGWRLGGGRLAGPLNWMLRGKP